MTGERVGMDATKAAKRGLCFLARRRRVRATDGATGRRVGGEETVDAGREEPLQLTVEIAQRR
jgi:hypothetical protein